MRRDAGFLQRVQKFRVRKYSFVGAFIFNRVAAGVTMGISGDRIKNSCVELVNENVERTEDSP
jgi:hypothetical protein